MQYKKLFASASLALFLVACATAPEDQTPIPQKIADANKEQAITPAPWEPSFYNPVPMPSAPLNKNKTFTRITFGSCYTAEKSDAIWSRISEAQSDAFLFIGDNVYGDVKTKDPGLPELRDQYGKLAASKGFAEFRQSTPVLSVWDDHDFGLNDMGADFFGREASEDLFNYVWAIPEDDPQRQHDGIYSSRIIGMEEGKQVQIIMLDTRYFRSPLKPTDERGAKGKERYIPDPDPSKTMLGEEQWQWLRAELEKPADVRLIVSSIQVIADGHGYEAWRQLPLERQKLYDTINASGANGVILLSGDRHAAGLYKNTMALSYPLYEITSSSLNLPLSAWVKPENLKQEYGPYRMGDNYFEVNFGAIDFDWQTRRVTLNIMDEHGRTIMAQTIAMDDLLPGN